MMKHIACSGIALVLFLGLTGLPAGAQNQAPTASQNSSSGSSLGDYARQVRKDPGAPSSKPKVFDNDNLPKVDKLSVIGQTPATITANSADAKGASSDSAKPAEGDAKPANDNKASEAKAGAEVKAPLTSTPKAPEDEAAKQWGDKIASQKEQIDLLARELDVTQREYQIRAAAMYADAGNRMRNSADWDKQDAQY